MKTKKQESENKQKTAKRLVDGIRTVLLISDEKSFLRGLLEWAGIVVVNLVIISLVSLIEYVYSSTPNVKQSLGDLIKHTASALPFELLVILSIFIKYAYNLSKILQDEVANDVRDDLAGEVETFHKSVEDIKSNLGAEMTTFRAKVEDIISKVGQSAQFIDNYLRRSKIVFEAGIKPFRHEHLVALESLLIGLPPEVHHVYCIDNSDPISWWSETMIGYLAVLARWKSMNEGENHRAVTRVFVCRSNDLLSPVLVKTLVLHTLMGFNTYVFSQEMFHNIYKRMKEEKGWIIQEKEVLVWDESQRKSVKVDIEVKDPERVKKLTHIDCYQSFWGIDSDFLAREQRIQDPEFLWDNYHGGKIRSGEIKVWFEFIGFENNRVSVADDAWMMECWQKIPLQYGEFIKALTNLAQHPREASDLHKITGTDFGIVIKALDGPVDPKDEEGGKTNLAQMGGHSEIITEESVKAILDAYHKINEERKI